MKILVALKRTIDYNVRVQIRDDGSGVVTDGIKHSINPFDEIALEQAIRWQDDGQVDEVVAVTIGSEPATEQLKTAAAFGCGRVIHIAAEDDVQPPAAARVISAVAKAENADMVLMGKQAIDDDCGQTGPMTAAQLGWPQASFASAIELTATNARVTRELDSGLETLDVDLPALITADLRLAEPRYLRLPDIMRGKKQAIEHRHIDEFDVADAPALELERVAAPPPRTGGQRVANTDALIAELETRQLL
ncbi:electron transfer flavoprotein subunit beta/FixA family protein [Salinisphaera sp. USBA-960]|nr:electron transfer flavoprotein subunit beta/FixA family protein [Salifodinibacter halophilus]NNC25681.1 electron transfer flavoprotein subunit beta/FixA family protein [Salifodinibacter halophilus]